MVPHSRDPDLRGTIRPYQCLFVAERTQRCPVCAQRHLFVYPLGPIGSKTDALSTGPIRAPEKPRLPAMLLTFAAYSVAYEEIHWRIHQDEWLPPGLRLAREHHFAHHAQPDARFNVFLPLFDWLLGRAS